MSPSRPSISSRPFGLKRILIVDFDLHHGNGTQHSFEERDDVLYFSTHQFPHYPGTGHWSEAGKGKGEGYTMNVPLSAGKSDGDFLYIFRRLLAPVARAFKPEFILVSAGFDIFAGDPLGGMEVTIDGFGTLAAELQELARSVSAGRILYALEGGYDLSGQTEGVRRTLLAMGGSRTVAPAGLECLSLDRGRAGSGFQDASERLARRTLTLRLRLPTVLRTVSRPLFRTKDPSPRRIYRGKPWHGICYNRRIG